MDKRWILILIILIVGCVCIYFIVDSSTTVGDAITVVNKSVITLPQDFTIGDDDKNSVELIDKNTHESIYIKDLGKGDKSFDCFKDELNSLNKNDEVNILSNSTVKIGDINTYKIDLQNLTSSENSTIAYIYTSNHTFTLKFYGYSNQNDLNNDLDFIVSTISPDFKQAQD